MKKILIVTESIDVNDSSGTKGRVALIQNLHKARFQLKVYHYTRKELSLEGIPCVAVKEQKATSVYVLSKLQLFLKQLTGWNANTFVEKTKGFSFAFFNDSYSISKALQSENPDDYDWVLTLSKAGSFRSHKALLGLPKWHSKWLAYIHDPYPKHSYPRPYDWVEPGHQKKKDFFLKIADRCRYALYPSELLGDWMESYYKKLKGKAVIIPHQHFQLSETPQKNQTIINVKEFSILHAGTLLRGRNPMGLVQGFLKFLENHPEAQQHARLLFLGSKNFYSNELNALKSSHPQIYSSDGYVPFNEVFYLQSKAVVNVILEAKGPFSPFLPGKFPHCIAAEKPILLLGPSVSESRRLLGDNHAYWSEIDDIDKICKHLTTLYELWKKNPELVKQDYTALKYYFSNEYLKSNFQTL